MRDTKETCLHDTFNCHYSEDGARPMYDLMNPVIISKDEAIVTCLDDNPKENKPEIKKGNIS